MQKTILRFGLISGIIASVFMLATVPFMSKLSHGNLGYVLGYTGMILSFLMVYFGIRSYRDNTAAGQITFGKGFAIGILITLISCAFYVITWEIVYFAFMPHFMDSYFAGLIHQAQSAGLDPATTAKKVAAIQQSQRFYQTPLGNMLYTFIEPFPIGLLATLVSAAVLRKKSPTNPITNPMPAA